MTIAHQTRICLGSSSCMTRDPQIIQALLPPRFFLRLILFLICRIDIYVVLTYTISKILRLNGK